MNNVQNALTHIQPIFKAIEDALHDYHSEENYKIPDLVGAVALKLHWSEKDVRAHEAVIRYYVRNHHEWYVTRGAHGGVQRVSVRDAKETAKKNKIAAKADLRASIEAKLTDPIAVVASSAA